MSNIGKKNSLDALCLLFKTIREKNGDPAFFEALESTGISVEDPVPAEIDTLTFSVARHAAYHMKLDDGTKIALSAELTAYQYGSNIQLVINGLGSKATLKPSDDHGNELSMLRTALMRERKLLLEVDYLGVQGQIDDRRKDAINAILKRNGNDYQPAYEEKCALERQAFSDLASISQDIFARLECAEQFGLLALTEYEKACVQAQSVFEQVGQSLETVRKAVERHKAYVETQTTAYLVALDAWQDRAEQLAKEWQERHFQPWKILKVTYSIPIGGENVQAILDACSEKTPAKKLADALEQAFVRSFHAVSGSDSEGWYESITQHGHVERVRILHPAMEQELTVSDPRQFACVQWTYKRDMDPRTSKPVEIRLHWSPHLPLPELPDFGKMPSIDMYGLEQSDVCGVLNTERKSHCVTNLWIR